VAEERSRRTFSKQAPRPAGLGAVDVVDRAMLLWSFIAGAMGLVMGSFLGVLVAREGWPTWIAWLCPFAGAAVVVGLVHLVVGGATRTAGTIYNPSGRTTPHRREHSGAEALAARGLYEEAVAAFETAVAEDPTDPGPYLRVARIYRDHLGRPEDAARWFRRAFREAAAAPAIARKELVELYVHRMQAPAKAAPELARMAEELAGTPEGAWAAAELRHVKELLAGKAEEA
jgi:tetratricopeptide (TPR) repeat protein